MADIDHARADEGLVDPVPGHFGQRLDVVRVVGTGQEGLRDLGQVDLQDGGVSGVLVPLEEAPACQPCLGASIRRLERLRVLIALVDHLFHQGDVAPQERGDLVRIEGDDASGRRPLGRGVGQLVGLIHGQVRAALPSPGCGR